MAIIIVFFFISLYFVVSPKTTAKIVYLYAFAFSKRCLHILFLCFVFIQVICIACFSVHAFLSRSLSLPARFAFRNFSIRHKSSTKTETTVALSLYETIVTPAAHIASITLDGWFSRSVLTMENFLRDLWRSMALVNSYFSLFSFLFFSVMENAFNSLEESSDTRSDRFR